MASVLFPSSSPKRPLRNVNANGLMLAGGEVGLHSFCPCSLSGLFKLAPGSYLVSVGSLGKLLPSVPTNNKGNFICGFEVAQSQK